MVGDKRTARRVDFEKGFNSTVVAVDGTWSLQAAVEDISVTGARLHLFGAIHPRMNSEEFFVVMTADGKVRRQSRLIWQRQNRIGVEFIQAKSRRA